MRVVAKIPKSADRCWRVFTDTSLLRAWVPGLRSATVVRRTDDGLPLEVSFEFGRTLSYTLVYEYDAPAYTASWQPRIGGRDAVSGSVRFEADGEGCAMTYDLEPSATPAPRERSEDDAERAVAAFAAFMRRAG